MSNLGSIIAGGVSAALLATSATPAIAGGWGGFSVSSGFGYGSHYGGYKRRWRHRDRIDTGDVIAGIAIIGAIAAIAASSSRSRRESRSDSRWDGVRVIVSEDQAVDACADAAERQGGKTASVRDILQVDRTSDGWDVEGTIEQRDGWRDKTPERRRFTCSVRFGDIDHVYIDMGVVAAR